MAATDDPIVPLVNGRILAKLIPKARLVTINDGHLFLVTQPKDCAQIVADFLN
jgi:pimeloyl-ACP methyl ester carboxylesterase